MVGKRCHIRAGMKLVPKLARAIGEIAGVVKLRRRIFRRPVALRLGDGPRDIPKLIAFRPRAFIARINHCVPSLRCSVPKFNRSVAQAVRRKRPRFPRRALVLVKGDGEKHEQNYPDDCPHLRAHAAMSEISSGRTTTATITISTVQTSSCGSSEKDFRPFDSRASTRLARAE